MRIACPGKHEGPDGQNDGTEDHGREAVFRNRFAVLDVGPGEARSGAIGDYARAEDDADNEGCEGKLGDAERLAALLDEGDRILRRFVSHEGSVLIWGRR